MRRLVMVMMLASCAPTVAVLVKRPGEGGGGIYAAVNEAETGSVAYRVRSFSEAPFLDGRPKGQELMFTACDGPYRIESEDSDTTRLGNWRLARFTCVNGPPVAIDEKIAQRLHVATGCPREYIFVESTGVDLIRFQVCQARYACATGGDAGTECQLSR